MRSPSNVFYTGKSSEKLNGMEKKATHGKEARLTFRTISHCKIHWRGPHVAFAVCSFSDDFLKLSVGDLKRERSAEHKSGCVALYCIFEGYCDELPSCRGQTSNTPPQARVKRVRKDWQTGFAKCAEREGGSRGRVGSLRSRRSRGPPPRKQRRMATRLYVQDPLSLFVKGKA